MPPFRDYASLPPHRRQPARRPDVRSAAAFDDACHRARDLLYLQAQRDAILFGIEGGCATRLAPAQGTVRFMPSGLPQVTAEYQVVGTYRRDSSRFEWSWACPSISRSLTVATRGTRHYGRIRRWSALTSDAISCTQALAWDLTAVVSDLSGASGGFEILRDAQTFDYIVYRAPAIVTGAFSIEPSRPSRVARVGVHGAP